MVRISILFLLVFLGISGGAWAETLEYQVSWLGVPVGEITLTTTEAASNEIGNREKLVKMDLRAHSNPYLQSICPVEIEVTSFLDPAARSPRLFRAYVRRRRKIHTSTVTFDPAKKTAFHRLPKGKSATVPITPATQDGLSFLYYVRTLDFQVGQVIPLQVSADGKNWDLTGKIERLSRLTLQGVGSWLAVESSLKLADPVPFYEQATAQAWFSADPERIPLLARIQSIAGPVTVVLVHRKGPKA